MAITIQDLTTELAQQLMDIITQEHTMEPVGQQRATTILERTMALEERPMVTIIPEPTMEQVQLLMAIIILVDILMATTILEHTMELEE